MSDRLKRKQLPDTEVRLHLELANCQKQLAALQERHAELVEAAADYVVHGNWAGTVESEKDYQRLCKLRERTKPEPDAMEADFERWWQAGVELGKYEADDLNLRFELFCAWRIGASNPAQQLAELRAAAGLLQELTNPLIEADPMDVHRARVHVERLLAEVGDG